MVVLQSADRVGTPWAMRHLAAGLLLLILGCKGAGSGPSVADAAADGATVVPSATPTEVVSADAGPVDAEPGGAEAGGAPDAEARPDGELTLDVRGAYCTSENQNAPGCHSYTYVLRQTDGKLRGGRRRSPAPLGDVDLLFNLAREAFDAKHTCIPNGPDRVGQTLKLRRNGNTETARGGCGPRFDDVTKRIENLAAGS